MKIFGSSDSIKAQLEGGGAAGAEKRVRQKEKGG